MTSWNYGDLYAAIAAVQPEAPAIIQGERRLRWQEFDAQSRGLAAFLLDRGVQQQDKVAIYCYNSPEYLISTAAALRSALVPVNTNYRYGTEELTYLFGNADAVAVIFHGIFTEQVDAIRGDLHLLTTFIHVDDGTTACPPWATPFEAGAATPGTGEPAWGRHPDDLVMLYTGGTTGMPKGVMWRQDDLFCRLNAAGFRRFDLDAGVEAAAAAIAEGGPGTALLPACPLMHGTGLFTALECLAEGGRVVLLPSRHFSAVELASTIDAEGVEVCVIVGDPFARPLLEAVRANAGSFSLESLKAMMSSGAMWSAEIKAGLLEVNPAMALIDAFSSSEALGMGSSVSVAGQTRSTADFTMGPEVCVVRADGTKVEPDHGDVGMLAVGGRNPVGYYKDEAKTEATFRTIDGVRYSIPGDFATVASDGTIHVLGRGSQCINTAGEKVYPEEVEEVLKTHPAVADACVVGIPDERFGERVVAAIELRASAPEVDLDQVVEHVKAHLAHYKAPRGIRVVDTIGRSPSGKMDYRRHREAAISYFSDATAG